MQLRFSTLTSALALFTILAAAATTTSNAASTTEDPNAVIGPTTAAANVQPGPGTNGYSYVGCYNESTGVDGSGGVRALAGGSMESNTTATTKTCLTFCAAQKYQYCGLEYGRECWGAPYLNAYSTKLDDSKCIYACEGNASEVCGGSLTISLYNLTGKATTSGASRDEVAWGLGAGMVMIAGMSAVFLGL